MKLNLKQLINYIWLNLQLIYLIIIIFLFFYLILIFNFI